MTKGALFEELRKLAGLSEMDFSSMRRTAYKKPEPMPETVKSVLPKTYVDDSLIALADRFGVTVDELVSDEFIEKVLSADENQDKVDELEEELEEAKSKYCEVPETVRKTIRFREEFPFLNEKDCPNEFKILVSDMFSAYDLYRENKNFLESEGIITFTDASGRLMALKPDVTMSIVKHTKPDAVSSKLYYVENVFRLAPQSGEYREISQMGLEFIGGQGGYAEAEAVELAVRSLAAIGPQSVLDVGHMGFITSLLDVLGVREEARAAALDALRAKNAHTLRAIAAESGCTEEEAGQLAALAALAGPFPETLDAARALVAAPGMADACGELQSLYDALEAVDAADTLRLDFSTLNDIDYYNGVVFKGYVRGVPRAVLAGGRYDNLMRRFGKPQPAVGFALYLGGLGRAFAEKSDYDVDTLLLYDAGQSPAQVARAVQSILKSGRSVRAEQSAPEGLRVRQTLRLGPDGAVPVTGGGGIC